MSCLRESTSFKVFLLSNPKALLKTAESIPLALVIF